MSVKVRIALVKAFCFMFPVITLLMRVYNQSIIPFMCKEFYFCQMTLVGPHDELLHYWSNNSLSPIFCLRLTVKCLCLPTCSQSKSLNMLLP